MCACVLECVRASGECACVCVCACVCLGVSERAVCVSVCVRCLLIPATSILNVYANVLTEYLHAELQRAYTYGSVLESRVSSARKMPSNYCTKSELQTFPRIVERLLEAEPIRTPLDSRRTFHLVSTPNGASEDLSAPESRFHDDFDPRKRRFVVSAQGTTGYVKILQ